MPTPFKDIAKIQDESSDRPNESPARTANVSAAASGILAAHDTKDRRIAIRVSTNTYNQFITINRRCGASTSSVINILIAEYIKEHQDLLQ